MENNDYPSNKSRRQFIKTSVIGGLAVISLPPLASGKSVSQNKSFDIKPFDLDEITIAELSDGLKSGKYTVRSIAEMYIN
ncbi:MAG TPA: hypothetical protein VI230_07300, partial [Ignavibacteriaceae bacterium]